MRFIYAAYNVLHNCIDVTTFDGYVLRTDCGKAEKGLKTTPCSECAGRFFRIVVTYLSDRGLVKV